ncbi:hypothetical protein HOF40_00670 [Candidatus Parcubacteria bacterium]|nr:hypothetical protein [Candidatus Parcubacteria bacterium]
MLTCIKKGAKDAKGGDIPFYPVKALAKTELAKVAAKKGRRDYVFELVSHPGNTVSKDSSGYVSLDTLRKVAEETACRKMTITEVALFLFQSLKEALVDESKNDLIVLLACEEGASQDAIVITRHHGELVVGFYARFEQWLAEGYDFLFVK